MKKSMVLLILMLASSLLLAACTPPATVPAANENEPQQQPAPQAEEEPIEVGTPIGEDQPAPTKALPSPTPEPTEAPTPEPIPPPEPTPAPVPETGAIAMQLNEPLRVDLAGDGQLSEVLLTEQSGLLALRVSGHFGALDMPVENAYLVAAYYVQTEGGDSFAGDRYALVSYDIGSDDYITNVYRFYDGQIIYLGNLYGYVTRVDGIDFSVFDYIYAIGTWGATRDYVLATDGAGDPYTGEYQIAHDYLFRSMFVSTPIPAQMLESGRYVDVTLPAGEMLDFVSTDSRSYMRFTLADGREGILAFQTEDDWRQYIDGKLIYECFEEVLDAD